MFSSSASFSSSTFPTPQFSFSSSSSSTSASLFGIPPPSTTCSSNSSTTSSFSFSSPSNHTASSIFSSAVSTHRGASTAPSFSNAATFLTDPTTAKASEPKQASEQNIKEKTSKPSEEEVKSKEHTTVIGKSESVDGLESKANGSNCSGRVTDSAALNKEMKGVGNAETDNKSANSPTETVGEKFERFSYTRVLRGITHNPHFTPLQSYSKRSKEKLIVGWDEIFEETIDQIQGLTAKTFSTNVHELWKTISELENLGYNVARLKKRLDELTEVMARRNSSQVEISDMRAKAEYYRKEKKKLEDEIVDLQAQAEKAQVMADEQIDQVEKMEGNMPVVDALFENLAKNPL